MTKYIDVTEIAKHIRKVLKSNFPDTKFSVRSSRYAGGASIDIYWTDGPTASMVDPLVTPYQSVSHMDITDLVHYKDSEIEGEEIRSGAHYIFTKRKISAEHARKAALVVCKDTGHDPDELTFTEHKFFTSIEGPQVQDMVDGLNLTRPMSLRQAIRDFGQNLTPDELDAISEQAEVSEPYLRMNKNGRVTRRMFLTEASAKAMNESLTKQGLNYRWVQEEREIA